MGAGRRLRRPARDDRPAGGASEHGGRGRGGGDWTGAERGRPGGDGAGGAGARPSAGGPSGHDSAGTHHQPAGHDGADERGPDNAAPTQPSTCAVEQRAAQPHGAEGTMVGISNVSASASQGQERWRFVSACSGGFYGARPTSAAARPYSDSGRSSTWRITSASGTPACSMSCAAPRAAWTVQNPARTYPVASSYSTRSGRETAAAT